MKITSAVLTEAATLSSQIEGLVAQRDELSGKIAELDKQISPLQNKFNSIVGGLGNGRGAKVAKCSRKGSRFTPEQRAKISEGLKAKWAARKAAASAPATPEVMPIAAAA